MEAAGSVRAPTVYFGCTLDAIGECDTDVRQNVLATTGATPAWRDRFAEAARTSGAHYVLVLELPKAG